MQKNRIVQAAGLVAGLGAAAASLAAPPFTITTLVKSGDSIPGVGALQIIGFGDAIPRVAGGNNGSWLVHVDTRNSTFPDTDEALLRDTLGLTPFIPEGIEGYLTAPDPDLAVTDFSTFGLNNVGGLALGLSLGPGEFSTGSPTTVAMFGTSAVLAEEDEQAAGFPAGVMWNPLSSGLRIAINDAADYLLIGSVEQSGQNTDAAVLYHTDGSGNVLNQSVLARVGSPSPMGGTWSTLSTASHGSAINATGQAMLCGAASNGSSAITIDGGIIAQQGGATPVAGRAWGPLDGASVDLNDNGQYAFRALTALGNGVWTETGTGGGGSDTGEDPVGAERTFGNGPLTRIDGSLATMHDVDFYGIRITDPAQFSASTVGGATADTVLYLYKSNPQGVVRNDDQAIGISQSRIDGASVPVAGFYYLAIATPRSRPVGASFNFAMQRNEVLDLWGRAPFSVSVDAPRGKVMWTQSTTGAIMRANLDGTAMEALNIGTRPSGPIAVDAVAGKVYWLESSPGSNIRRANVDGTTVESILSSQASANTFAATGLAVHRAGASGRVFWTRRQYGEIWRCTLAGGTVENIIKIPPTIIVGVEGSFAPTDIAVDSPAGKIYWCNPGAGKIQRANLDGTSIEDVALDTSPSGIAVDSTAGIVYWTSLSNGVIRKIGTNGAGLTDVLGTEAPGPISFDSTSGGRLFWGNGQDRIIRRAATNGSGLLTAVNLGQDTALRLPDGPAPDAYMLRWDRTGSAGGSAAYQIALTGATYQYEEAMLVKGGQKIAAVGDVLDSIAPHRLVRVGFDRGPVEISNRGDVLWWGEWADPNALITNALNPNRYLPRRSFGLFYNTDLIMEVNEHVLGLVDELADVHEEEGSLQMSHDGRFAVVRADTRDPGSFAPMRYRALLLEFDLPPLNTCPCDWNMADGLDSQDYFDFINDFFLGTADFNGVDGTDSQDYFDFLDCFFTGCPE